MTLTPDSDGHSQSGDDTGATELDNVIGSRTPAVHTRITMTPPIIQVDTATCRGLALETRVGGGGNSAPNGAIRV